jgi:hypothetical protein
MDLRKEKVDNEALKTYFVRRNSEMGRKFTAGPQSVREASAKGVKV